MKTAVRLALGMLITICTIGCSKAKSTQSVFYVSLDGRDSWSGKLSEPNKDGTDGPFASLEKARDAVRALKHSKPSLSDTIRVFIRGGTYPITQTFKLTAEDSGTETAPVIWSNFPDEEVRFIGGKVVTGFSTVSDSMVISRLAPEGRDKVVCADLKAQGISDYGAMSSGGWGRMRLGLELFFKGEPMTITRYPNEGWLKIKDVPQSGGELKHPGDRTPGHIRDGIPAGRHYGRFVYDSDRPERWAHTNDIWMHGYWVWDWADTYEKVQRIDTAKHEIYPAEPYSSYGYHKGQRYRFLNILEELDAPGEYYLDREKGVLYFFPPEEILDGDAVVSVLADVMVSLKETSHVTVQGITFECSRARAVDILGGTGNIIAGCIMRNLGDSAVTVNGGTKNGVVSCTIYNVEGGISISGGDRKTLTPAGNYAANNDIHHYSRINRTIQSAISLNGVGNILSHNYIHDAPHMGVGYGGNDHILEFNEVCRIALETGDVGAFYNGRDWTQRGTIIRHNYFHDIIGPGGLHGVMGVYCDDLLCGVTVYGNVFHRINIQTIMSGSAVHIGGGRDNTVENNIFVECTPSVHVDARGLLWRFWFNGEDSTMFKGLEAVNYKEPPYSERYPGLATILEDNPDIPKNNKILHNVSYGGRFLDLYTGMDFSLLTVKDNLIADPELCKIDLGNRKKFTTYKYGDKEFMDKLKDNMVINTDPGFVDFANGNFQLKDDSPAYKLGFKRIPIEEIGLRIDRYRKTITK